MRKNAAIAAALVAAITLVGCSGNTPDIEGRITDFENRVATLEQGSPPPRTAPVRMLSPPMTVRLPSPSERQRSMARPTGMSGWSSCP